MSAEVAGESLEKFEGPIKRALTRYSHLTGSEYTFDNGAAGDLEFVRGKSTARSITQVFRREEPVAELAVVAFGPGDGTGDESSYGLNELNMGDFSELPRSAQRAYIPRRKGRTHSEVHLPLASLRIGTAKPVRFAGSLSLLGLREGMMGGMRVTNLGYVGQPPYSFAASFERDPQHDFEIQPRATLTTGYRQSFRPDATRGIRLGDPHAIANLTENTIQVAGFIALSDDAIAEHHELFERLGAEAYHPYPLYGPAT